MASRPPLVPPAASDGGPAGPQLEAPYDRLADLPRSLWLPGLVTSAGERGARLLDTRRWLQALQAGELPPTDADFGDAQAATALRPVVGALGLAPLCRGVPALAEQVVRTLLWHLDRIVDHQPRSTREAAVATVAAEFHAAWAHQSQGLDEDLALLRALGDATDLTWDRLQGQLNSRGWQAARRAAEWLRQLPELAEVIRRLGRSRPQEARDRPPPPTPEAGGVPPLPLRAEETLLPDAPGAIVGVRLSGQPERMLASEAVMLRHPVWRKLWRARHAEARLLSWQTEARLVDWRPDPQAQRHGPATDAAPAPQDRGPMILCLDTSGSMRGAPENIAKAVVVAALRTAHDAGRACRLIAFGGPGELLERELGRGPEGLQAVLDLMGQAFDGGTDVQAPIERAIERVHEAAWRQADLLIVSDGEFGCVPQTLDRLDAARAALGLRVQGVLVGDRETMGLMETCDDLHWVRDWRRYAEAADGGDGRGYSPVHSKSLTALYFPNALSERANRRRAT